MCACSRPGLHFLPRDLQLRHNNRTTLEEHQIPKAVDLSRRRCHATGAYLLDRHRGEHGHHGREPTGPFGLVPGMGQAQADLGAAQRVRKGTAWLIGIWTLQTGRHELGDQLRWERRGQRHCLERSNVSKRQG